MTAATPSRHLYHHCHYNCPPRSEGAKALCHRGGAGASQHLYRYHHSRPEHTTTTRDLEQNRSCEHRRSADPALDPGGKRPASTWFRRPPLPVRSHFRPCCAARGSFPAPEDTQHTSRCSLPAAVHPGQQHYQTSRLPPLQRLNATRERYSHPWHLIVALYMLSLTNCFCPRSNRSIPQQFPTHKTSTQPRRAPHLHPPRGERSTAPASRPPLYSLRTDEDTGSSLVERRKHPCLSLWL